MEIVYEDSDLLVINKPSGLIIDREAVETPSQIRLWRMVVHRLDKDTSGLLVFAKTEEALENLQRQFKERRVKKRYLALVHGKVTHPSGVIDKPIGRAPKGIGKFVVVEGGRSSVTKYVVAGPESASGGWPAQEKARQGRAATNGFTLLDLEPLTGRTHQIRVHLKSIGHPIVGDKLYASRRQQKEDEEIIKRQFLHAYRLSFTHPRTGEWLTFELGLPEDLERVLEKIEGGG